MENNRKNDNLAILGIIKNCWDKKFLFVKVGLVCFILACLIIIPVPRYYWSTVKLAPELGFDDGTSSIGALANQFGLSFGGGTTGDAISPTIYPDVIHSYAFAKRLASIPVTTADSTLTCTYYTYIEKHQKKNPLFIPFRAAKRFFSSLFTSKKDSGSNSSEKDIDVFRPSKSQASVLSQIVDNLSCNIDIKTNLITIGVKDQDPLISASMAEIVSGELQKFIIDYRTNKANVDYLHYRDLVDEARSAYLKAQQDYASFSEGNTNVLLPRYRMKLEALENDMQLKFNAYSSMVTLLQTSEAKVQEKTPVFTVVNNASVALKPSGPKRMIFIFVMLVISMACTMFYVNLNDMKKLLK